jgi:serine protease AprX
MTHARRAVQRSLGAALAAKATDGLCVVLARGSDGPIRAAVMFGDDAPPHGPLPQDTAARGAAIAGRDAAFRRAAAPVAETTLRHAPQPCWLSRTLHVVAGARQLAAIADEHAVRRIDAPPCPRAEQRTGAHLSVTLTAAIAAAGDLGLSGSGVAVGVLDREVQIDHPALLGRVVHAADFTGVTFGSPERHGTAMAGIIAANHPSFRGIAPAATIHNYKIIATGLDAPASPDLAIERALADGLRVVNCSWGAGPAGAGSSPVARACDAAWKAGMAIVKSSGDDDFTTPADAEGVIAVGTTDMAGRRLAEDNAAGMAHGRPRPHLVAPGGAFGEHPTTTDTGGAIRQVKGGASIAAAHVTGLIALALEREPHLEPDELRGRLLAACTPLAATPAAEQGAGIVDPRAFLRL